MTLDFETLNYFRPGSEIHQDPYPYYEWLRAHGPVWQHPRGVVFVTGYDETITIYHAPQTWSNCNTNTCESHRADRTSTTPAKEIPASTSPTREPNELTTSDPGVRPLGRTLQFAKALPAHHAVATRAAS